MIWVAWRQQRMQLLISVLLVGLVSALLAFFRFDALEYLRSHGIEGCLRIEKERCTSSAMNAFASEYRTYVSVVPMLLLCLPVLLGMFAGAPLFAREFEQGTHIFALSQGVRRGRWWATKLVVAGVPVIGAVAALGLAATWGLRPLNFVTHGRMMTPGFETQGLVVAAYAALAFALGATVGLLARNTVIAMAATLALYVVFVAGVGAGARPMYLDPVEKRGSVTAGAAIGSGRGGSVVPDDAWRVGDSYFDASGAEVTFDPSSCQSADSNIETCLERQGIATVSARFHPDENFWKFQLAESGIVLVIGFLLLGLGGWGLHKRLL